MKSRPPVDQDLLAVIGPEAIVEANRRLAMLDAVAYAATRMVAGDWRNHMSDFLKRLGEANRPSVRCGDFAPALKLGRWRRGRTTIGSRRPSAAGTATFRHARSLKPLLGSVVMWLQGACL